MKEKENTLQNNTMTCPNCNSAIETNPGYVDWCETCSWNLKYYEPEEKKENIIDTLYKKTGKRFGNKKI
jgi:predicted amidophosphoribosyltransferase